MKPSTTIVVIIILIICAVFIIAASKNYRYVSPLETLQNKQASSSRARDCEGVSGDAAGLLSRNVIDLKRLNGIDPNTEEVFSYAPGATKFTYETYRLDTTGGSQRLILKACLNGRQILDDMIAITFDANGTFRSAFAFDFSVPAGSANPSFSIDDAKRLAYRTRRSLTGTEPALGYMTIGGSRVLVWSFGTSGSHVVIDAQTGTLVSQ